MPEERAQKPWSCGFTAWWVVLGILPLYGTSNCGGEELASGSAASVCTWVGAPADEEAMNWE